MKTQEEIRKNKRLLVVKTSEDGGSGFLQLGNRVADSAVVVWSFGGGWDHVSVSYSNRCPTWDEMCKVKDMFFGPDECCIEYHPAEKDYVNVHPYCLHIWRPQGNEIPKPPKIFV